MSRATRRPRRVTFRAFTRACVASACLGVVAVCTARRDARTMMARSSSSSIRGDAVPSTSTARDSSVTPSMRSRDELRAPTAWTSRVEVPRDGARTGTGTCAPPGERRDARGDVDALETTEACARLDALRPKDSSEYGVLVIARGGVKARVEAAKAAKARAVVAAATSEREAREIEDAGVPVHLPRERADANGDGWLTVAWVLERGHVAVLASSEVRFKSNPLVALRDDGADVSGTVRGDGRRSARVQGMSDPKMGWSQYSQSMVVPLIRTSFVVLRPTRATRSLAEWLASSETDYDATDDAFTDEVLLPAHDARQRAGVSFRLLNSECFSENGDVVAVPDGTTRWNGERTGENAIIAEKPDFTTAKAHVTRDEKCAIAKREARVGPEPRPLRYIADPKGDYPVGCDEFPDLCDVVRRVALNREVLAAVSNKNIFYMLGLYIDGLKRTNITNYVIVALDEETAEWCKERDVPYYHRELKSITGSTDNHATSGLKFRVLNEFVSTGTSVLLSDVDVVWMQDPFANGLNAKNERLIYRDSDVEGMTDGWDDVSSYGFSWNGMRRLIARNSGLFYVAATHETKAMMTRLAERMATEKHLWDQTGYNEEQVYLWGQPGRGAYAGVSQRIMNYICFQNSKYLFRFMREDEELYPDFRPASVHINYHPEKPDRMVSVIAQYWNGEANAIDVWHWGEGRRNFDECTRREDDDGIAESALARALVKRTKTTPGKWGGASGLKLDKDGTLTTPWGRGKWGIVPSKEGSVYMDFIGAAHTLELTSGSVEDENAEFTFKSTRCKDGDEVEVRV